MYIFIIINDTVSRYLRKYNIEPCSTALRFELIDNICSLGQEKSTKRSIKNDGDPLSKLQELTEFARTVRNYFEKTIKRQANRLTADNNITDTELQTFTIEDLFDGKE
ncbi:hypothetical protein FACS1894109_09310 [Spirochaetia bacterium]|nr:hypothetical protein FACS1894109_09310 [Spirochaetia bacterium]